MRRSATCCFTIAVLVLLLAVACWSNPLPGVDIRAELRALAGAVADGGASDVREAFADSLGRYSIGFLDDETLGLMEEHFPSFEPLVIRAQMPGHYLDWELHEWFMGLADSAGRGLMTEVLRSWLTCRMADAPFSGHGYRRSDENRPELAKDEILQARVRAAEMLSDLGDAVSVPLVRSLQDSIVRAGGGWDSLADRLIRAWWYLDQSGRRAADSRGGRLAESGTDGRLVVFRDTSDVSGALYGDMGVSRHPSVLVDRRAGRRVLELLGASADAASRLPGFEFDGRIHGDGLLVQLDDGVALTVRLMKNGALVCHDNLRQSRPRYIVHNPELTALMEDIRAAYLEERGRYVLSATGGDQSGTPN